ncbi:uncharacterized protein BJ171DRAFT_505737 [Polychytrium aggregatum]|uniref:uncharacterized protein n=1 Tax=Polychytrium aggregatum TaxID=110093 RepID=UPI0022FDED17|nr:uncharacterized protein BJ171DRAFT_505737 [Polychytrium aggregatum]KAI9204409.1 hypothetical protein BJ171DRAFT_505737 [Polychytrium aggregatum]
MSSISTFDGKIDPHSAVNWAAEVIGSFFRKHSAVHLQLVLIDPDQVVVDLFKKTLRSSGERFAAFRGDTARPKTDFHIRSNMMVVETTWRLKGESTRVGRSLITAGNASLFTDAKRKDNSPLAVGDVRLCSVPRDAVLYTQEGIESIIFAVGPNNNLNRPDYTNDPALHKAQLQQCYSRILERWAEASFDSS